MEEQQMRMHMGHLALRATNAERTADHLGAILGLRRTGEAGGSLYLSCNEKHHEIQLTTAERPGLDHIGLEVEEEADLGRVRDALAAAGARILSETPEEPGLGKAIRAVGPSGLVLELYTEMAREPLSVEHYMPQLARRFGHVTLLTTERLEMQRFLVDVLGFRVTDVLADRVCWLRCDTDHHGIALREHTRNAIHHYAFQLEDWGTIERYCDNLARLGRRLVWGPGRHGPGRNLFTYLPDPDNTIVEAYADLLQVIDEHSYRPIDWSEPGNDALNLWGPLAPDNWAEYGVPILAPSVVPEESRR
jgi:catechol-2,3-dioxygenase